jgi:monoterpene epsilon-lactone hydrolase
MPSPEFEAVLAAVQAQPMTLPDDVRSARERIDEMLGSSPLAEGVSVVATTAGPCAAEWLTPAGADDRRVVLYLHGGGYRIGSIAGYRPLLSQFAKAFGIRLLAIEYRLAPEHPFPAAVDDALAAYRWLVDDGADAKATAIMGDSAGGGLAAACILAIKQAGLPQPGAVVCLSPFADLTLAADSYRRNAATDPYWDLAAARLAVTEYLAGARPRDPRASPVFGNFARTAPMLIHAASTEALADDAVLLAGAVHRSKGQVRCELWPDMTHEWHAMYPHVPEAREAVEAVAAFLHEHLV